MRWDYVKEVLAIVVYTGVVILIMRAILIMAVLILAACGSGGAPVFAESSLNLYLYNIKDPQAESLTPAQVEEVVRWVSDRYQEATGFTLTFAGYEEVSAAEVMPGIDLFNPDGYAQSRRLWAFNGWLGFTKRWHADAFQYGMLPPMNCNGMKCFGGMANFGCEYPGGGIAIGQAAEWSSHTPPRRRLPVGCGIPLAHEAGHGVMMFHHQLKMALNLISWIRRPAASPIPFLIWAFSQSAPPR